MVASDVVSKCSFDAGIFIDSNERPKTQRRRPEQHRGRAARGSVCSHASVSPYRLLKGLRALPGAVTAVKGGFIPLGLCSLGNESDLELEKKFKEEDREKAPRRPRTQRTEKAQRTASSGKEARQAAGAKKPIISVVLTAHEAIPGDHIGREVTK